MEFRFNVIPLFKTKIVRVTSNLLPQGFTGDRRSVLEAIARTTDIINEMGELSAQAQGLSKPVTTAQKLRNSDHIVYLLGEETGRNGCVTGLLKVGVKNLYIFDENGDTKPTLAMCVLDFYIHESRQRAGLGKEMFEVMLERENAIPQKLAIDRPSDKLLAFIDKHYGLNKTIPQMNNFVIYQGFFDDQAQPRYASSISTEPDNKVTSSPNTAFFGSNSKSDEYKKRIKHQSAPSDLPFIQSSPMGRFGAKRPTCSMAEIIHSTPTTIPSESHSDETSNDPSELSPTIDEIDGGASDLKSDSQQIDYSKSVEDIIADIESVELSPPASAAEAFEPPMKAREVKFDERSHSDGLTASTTAGPGSQWNRANKQHTGLKNISSNVGAAVMPSGKMEFDQERPESFGVVKIGRPVGKHANGDNADAMSTISSINSEGMTEQGYFDLKFYHNKLW